MRILYKNKLETAALTATTLNGNFPLSNILSEQLATPFRATDNSVTITGVFDTPAVVNAIGIAGHNVTAWTCRLYDDTGLIAEQSRTALKSDTMYFSDSPVTKVEIALSGADTVEVGRIIVGTYIQMPNPLAYYSEQLVVTNERTDTQFGAVYGSDGVLLRQLSPSFTAVPHTKFVQIATMMFDVRNCRGLFVDMTELNHVYKEPLYATLEMESVGYSRDSRLDKATEQRYAFSLEIKEAM